jgi:hypothetical protein
MNIPSLERSASGSSDDVAEHERIIRASRLQAAPAQRFLGQYLRPELAVRSASRGKAMNGAAWAACWRAAHDACSRYRHSVPVTLGLPSIRGGGSSR